MNMKKVATVSAYVVAVFSDIGGLTMGSGLVPAVFAAIWMFFLVKGVLLTPGYFMEGLRGTSDPPVNQSAFGEDRQLSPLDSSTKVDTSCRRPESREENHEQAIRQHWA